MNRYTITSLLALLALAACGQEEPASPEGERPETTVTERSATTGAELDAESRKRAEEALSAYEQIRDTLAADSLEGVPAAAKRLREAAAAAASSAPDALRPRFTAMADAAKALEDVSEIDEARRRFGELSRAVVALVADAPALAEGMYVFQCPMAKGYQKWVQAEPDLENPYMGTRMSGCGSATDWTP